jgi:glutathionylspermidine synthase
MERVSTSSRSNWQQAVERLGFGFHTTHVPYWDESVYYAFQMNEILLLEKATAELWDLCLLAVQHVIDQRLYAQFKIPSAAIPFIEMSWDEDHPSIYGRFDLCYRDGQVKMLEFNADTPTSLYEAGIVQWFWLQDLDKDKDQFNSIHEKLIGYWSYLRHHLKAGTLYFACLRDTLEDYTNTEYLRDCAMQAGIDTKFMYIDDIGWDDQQESFVDMECKPIGNLFKLYPWEWLMADEFGEHLLRVRDRLLFIEPAWKMILSNKAILPMLWELFPDHPYLLPAYFSEKDLVDYAKKPLLSREGANIEIRMGEELAFQTGGEYGEEGYIYQGLFPLPEFGGKYPLIGSWIIGQEPAGIGIREADGLITDNLSRFVPHLIR